MPNQPPSLFRSRVALEVAIALSQIPSSGATLRQIARALGARDSSIQRALDVLLASQFVIATKPGARGGSYVLDRKRTASDAFMSLAVNDVPRERAIAVACRSNVAVEFASLARSTPLTLLVVYGSASSAEERIRLKDLVRMLRGSPPIELLQFGHDEVQDLLRGDDALRTRAQRGQILVGRIERTFPDLRRHGDFDHARPLGSLSPQLKAPSRRALAALARKYELAAIRAFGSAVRDDFRPDSDVDILVRFKDGRTHAVEVKTTLKDEFERLLGRNVDVTDERLLRSPLRKTVERDAVNLYG